MRVGRLFACVLSAFTGSFGCISSSIFPGWEHSIENTRNGPSTCRRPTYAAAHPCRGVGDRRRGLHPEQSVPHGRGRRIPPARVATRRCTQDEDRWRREPLIDHLSPWSHTPTATKPLHASHPVA